MPILYISVYIQTHKNQHVNVIQIPTNTNEIKLPFAGKEQTAQIFHVKFILNYILKLFEDLHTLFVKAKCMTL